MHCKKCLHYDVCVKLGKPSLYGINREIGCSAYKDKTKWAEKKEPENNADRIRAMTDEELCEFLGEYKFCDICEEGCDSCTYNGDCDKRLLDWLKQTAE